MRGRKHLLAGVMKWRAKDRHTGIGRDGRVPYTYQHVDSTPKSAVEVYRVETFIPFRDIPIHRDVHYVPAEDLDAFFEGGGEHATIVVDVRPLTTAEALEELRRFRLQAEAAAGDERPSR
jgi:hypothetical protein